MTTSKRCQPSNGKAAHKILFYFCITLFVSSLSIAQSEKQKSKFPTKTIYIGTEKLKVEIAQTPEEQEQGLMFREKLPNGEGMLFIFENERPLNFWMKNTLIPLSIGFIDSKNKLFEIQDMEPASPIEQIPKTYNSKKPAKYALEVPQGWFKAKKIKPGVTLKFEK